MNGFRMGLVGIVTVIMSGSALMGGSVLKGGLVLVGVARGGSPATSDDFIALWKLLFAMHKCISEHVKTCSRVDSH